MHVVCDGCQVYDVCLCVCVCEREKRGRGEEWIT